MNSNNFSIRTENLSKVYNEGYKTVALQNVSLRIPRGSISCIMGPSGHGKSTLLHLIGGLDRPTSGKVYIEDLDISSMNPDRLAEVRCKRLGFVFQFFNLLPVLSVLENVEISIMLAGTPQKEHKERATELLRLVGLEEKRDAKPNQLSGGQRQRVAVARAMVNDPDILLMDEPTGNLDSKSEGELLEHIQSVNARGKTIVIVTHSNSVAAIAKHIFHIRDGMLCS